MRLLDPFAGVNLANAVPEYHLSLFLASFFVGFYPLEEETDVSKNIHNTFILLRWTHIVVFALLLIALYIQSDK